MYVHLYLQSIRYFLVCAKVCVASRSPRRDQIAFYWTQIRHGGGAGCDKQACCRKQFKEIKIILINCFPATRCVVMLLIATKIRWPLKRCGVIGASCVLNLQLRYSAVARSILSHVGQCAALRSITESEAVDPGASPGVSSSLLPIYHKL